MRRHLLLYAIEIHFGWSILMSLKITIIIKRYCISLDRMLCSLKIYPLSSATTGSKWRRKILPSMLASFTSSFRRKRVSTSFNLDDLGMYMHHIQLELRLKEYQKVKVLYESLLTIFTANIKIVSFLVLDYADFIMRYLRDV